MAIGQLDLGNSQVVVSSSWFQVFVKVTTGIVCHLMEVKARTLAASHNTTLVKSREI